MENTCTWTYDDEYGYYETECVNAYEFTNGRIGDNKFAYCPYCGKPIQEILEKLINLWLDGKIKLEELEKEK